MSIKRPKNGMRPVHPGEILREELEELGLSANTLAEKLDVAANRITEILRERRGVSADTALRLARYFGTTSRVWINLQKEYELRTAEIRVGQKIAASVQPRQEKPASRLSATPLQDLIRQLEDYWAERGCVILPALDLPVGAATFHPETFLRSLGPEPWNCAFAQPCRRPTDGRYGENPNRLQRYYQFQVVRKPSPDGIQDQYLNSLKEIGIAFDENDVRFVEDDWESPTLGAWGRGWEVQLNGMEISQFTYFQQVGGLECRPVLGEITYGLERLAMIRQEVDSVFDLAWCGEKDNQVTYGDLFRHNEVEQSKYNFDEADTEWLTEQFDRQESECDRLVEKELPLPAYEQLVLCSHTFNLLDARHAISVTERQKYILRICAQARKIAKAQYAVREALGFPLVQK